MKFQKITLLWVGTLAAVAGLSSCQPDPFEGIESNERAITDFVLPAGQIGVAEITRTTSDSKVVVYVVKGTDISKLTPRVLTSYKSSVTPASGTPTDFSKGAATYKVTSESGQSRDWTVEIKEYQSDLDGKWKMNALQFQYFIGEGESWGWNGTKKVSDNIADASKELDNTLEFTVTSVSADGKLNGTYKHDPGPDGAFADFQYKDVNYAYKFRKLPKNTGTWVRDFATNTLTFNPGTGESRTIALEFNFDKSILKVPFNVQPYDIDWNGDGNKKELGGAKFLWYMLQKVK